MCYSGVCGRIVSSHGMKNRIGLQLVPIEVQKFYLLNHSLLPRKMVTSSVDTPCVVLYLDVTC